MAIDFPTSPSLNDTYSFEGRTWTYNGTAWIATTGGATGATGPTGPTGPAGAAGSTWYSGSGVPADGLGVDGDYYLNTDTGDVYSHGGSVGWNFSGNIKGATGEASGGLTVMTALSTSSGTTKAFTIPSSAKRITMSFSSVQIDAAGGGKINLQLSTGGVYKTSGYQSAVALGGAAATGANMTTGFGLVHGAFNNNIHSGIVTLVNITGDTWVCAGVLGLDGAPYAYDLGGTVTLSGPIDGIRLISDNAGDSFDGGTIGCMYE